MKRYRISYFFGQAFKGMWRNRMMTLASVTVLLSCLIVMGCFAMLVINIERNLDSLGDLNEIVAFVDSEEPYIEGAKAPLAPALTAPGKTFLGWSTDPDATSPEFRPGDTYSVSAKDAVAGVITMYAVWQGGITHEGYTVRYHALGVNLEGTLPEDSETLAPGTSLLLAPAVKARFDNREFVGWSTDPNASLHSDGGSDTVAVTGDETTGETSEPTAPVGDGAPIYAPGDEYTVSADDARGGVITFYAIWEEKPSFTSYTLVYDTLGVEASGSLTDAEVRLNKIESQLQGLDNIAENGIVFVSREETLQAEKDKLKDYPSLFAYLEEGDNPYPDTFQITYKDNSGVDALKLQLDNIDGIYKTRCRADLARNIESLKHGIILVFSWFMAILFVVSIFVIINTVKLAVVHRSKEITIMRYVGATKWFIAFPFELEGIIIGLISGVAAFFIQWYMYVYVQSMIMNQIELISILPFAALRPLVLVGCLLIGVLTGLIGSMISIRKYLKA